MSEQTGEVMAATAGTEQNGSTDPAASAAAGATGTEQQRAEVDWKAKAREWEKRAKENSTAAARLAEIEESQKTAQQKLEERASAAEQRAAAAERELMRSRIASKHNLGDLAEFLTGDTEEELEQRAAKLAERVSATTPPSFDGGARGSAAGARSMNDLIRQAAGRG